MEWQKRYGNPEGISFWELVREDYERNGRDWTLPGFRALFVHRFANWRLGIPQRWLRAPLGILAKGMFRYIRNHYGIELQIDARVGRRVAIDHQSGIVIHGNTVIGDECRIRHNTTMGLRSVDDLAAAPTLESGVDVGVGAVIIGRITIGTGAVIGANAVVLDDVPPGAVAVGTPAAVRPRSTATTRDSASDR
jgi:serine O-acetyltransferase